MTKVISFLPIPFLRRFPSKTSSVRNSIDDTMRPLLCQVVAVVSACLFAARSVELPSIGSSVETGINSGSWIRLAQLVS